MERVGYVFRIRNASALRFHRRHNIKFLNLICNLKKLRFIKLLTFYFGISFTSGDIKERVFESRMKGDRSMTLNVNFFSSRN